MDKFNREYLKIIYNQKMNDHTKSRNITFEDKDLVKESTYFNKIDNQFQKYCCSLFDNMIKNKQRFKELVQAGYDIFLQDQIDIRQFLKHCPISKMGTYEDFNIFLQDLKNKGQGIITLQITNRYSNSYTFPIDFTKNKIRIIDRDINSDLIMNKVTQQYEQYIKQKTKQIKNNNQLLTKFKQLSIFQPEWGIISIYPIYFLDDKQKFKQSAIWHQFQHLFTFMKRINSYNYNLIQYHSNTIHNDFDSQNLIDKQEQLNYYLDSDEFKPLAGTFIEELKIIFNQQNIFSQQSIKEFLTALMFYCDIPIQYVSIKKQKQKIFQWLRLFDSKLIHKNQIKQFFKTIYLDGLHTKQDNESRNKWTILKKRIWRELNQHEN